MNNLKDEVALRGSGAALGTSANKPTDERGIRPALTSPSPAPTLPPTEPHHLKKCV